MRTWRVLRWQKKPRIITEWVPLQCPCGYDAECPAAYKAPIIAGIEMGLIFDPPGYAPLKNFLPGTIQCRKCGRIYTQKRKGKKCMENTSQAPTPAQ